MKRSLQIQTEVDLAVSSVLLRGETFNDIVTCWAAIDFCSHRDPFIPAPWDESDKSSARHWEKSVLLEAVPVPVSSEILKHEKLETLASVFSQRLVVRLLAT